MFDFLGLSGAVRSLLHVRLSSVRFELADGSGTEIPLPPSSSRHEITVRRSDLDHLLLCAAEDTGAEIRQEEALTKLEKENGNWKIGTNRGTHHARLLVAADGRNSTVCRMLGIAHRHRSDRVALQAHVPLDQRYQAKVALRLLPEGYCGIAAITGGSMNLCLVARPKHLDTIRQWAEKTFSLGSDNTSWQSITPLSRRPVAPSQENVLLVGDAARVVEPFTGEGIYYALKTGTLAAEAAVAKIQGIPHDYQAAHREVYKNRLWVNRLARETVTHPRVGAVLFRLGHTFPGLFRALTAKVILAGQ